MKWGNIKTTLGLILASANIAIYLLSGDKEFAATGKVTQIPYSATFCDRKKFIEQVATDSQSWILDLLIRWDQAVFDGVPDAIHHLNLPPVCNEQETARQALLKVTSMNYNPDQPDTEDFEYVNPSLVPLVEQGALSGIKATRHSVQTLRKQMASFTPVTSYSDSKSERSPIDNLDFKPAPAWYSQDVDNPNYSDIESLSFDKEKDSINPLSNVVSLEKRLGQQLQGMSRGKGRVKAVPKGTVIAKKPLARRSTRSRK
ncbi:hypothetical protein C0993_011796 [Termitomyces sp. T159_Od127]|nr:hypothetical protein C0993_011796 [Termitomyces sp. T159_Od127]